MTAPRLTDLLGFPPQARVLIVNCDDLGLLAEVNEGCARSLRQGSATSASLMVPCPQAQAGAELTAGLDVGVHLTVNCEFAGVRWGPLTAEWSLRDPDGSFPASFRVVQQEVDLAVLHEELVAQVRQALGWGVDPTHVDAHMYTVASHPRLVGTYLDVAAQFGLPARLAGSSAAPPSDFRARAADRGVLVADHLVRLPAMGSRAPLIAALADLRPGVTEFHAHPALDSPSLRAALPDWAARVDDYDLYVADRTFRTAIASSGAILVGHAALRDAMRRGW